MDEQVGLLEKAASDYNAATATLTKSASALDGFIAKFKEPKAEEKAPVADEKAKVGEGALAGITKTEILGLPIGQIVIGSAGGIFISELIDGFLAAQRVEVKGLLKLVMAAVVGKFGTRIMSKEASLAIALVLGVFGLSQVIPLDKWMAQLAGTIKGVLPGTIKVTGLPTSAVAQAQRVVEGYYDRLGGAR